MKSKLAMKGQIPLAYPPIQNRDFFLNLKSELSRFVVVLLLNEIIFIIGMHNLCHAGQMWKKLSFLAFSRWKKSEFRQFAIEKKKGYFRQSVENYESH